MATPNVIEYRFEGDTLDLESAIKRIDKVLRESAKTFKKYQDGTITESQKREIEQLRKLKRQLAGYSKLKVLTKEEEKRAKYAGDSAFKIASRLTRSARSVGTAGEKEAAKRHLDFSDANLFQAGVQARELQLRLIDAKSFMSPDQLSDLRNQLVAYNEVLKDSTASEEEKEEAINNINELYQDYNASLKKAEQILVKEGKVLQTNVDILEQFDQYMMRAVTSTNFWMNALKRLGEVIKQGITYYADYVESLNFLDRATISATEDLRKFTEQQSLAFGLDPTDINTATAMFYSFANSMGMANEEATLIAKNLTQLTQDIASLQNIDMETAMTKLRSALAGQSRALAQLGVNVSDTNMNEWLLSKGINKTMNDMNEASQAAARYAFILASTTTAQQDLAKTIESPANQFKILTTQLKLFTQYFGATFLPLIMPAVKILNNLLRPLNAFMQGLTSIAASGYSSSIGDAADAMGAFGDETEQAAKAVNGLTGLDEINMFNKNQGASGALGIVEDDIALLLTGYDNLSEGASKLVEIFGQMGETLAPFFAMLTNQTNFSMITAFFNTLYLVLWPVSKIFEAINVLLSAMPEEVVKVISVMTELGVALGSVLITFAALKTLLEMKWIQAFISNLRGLISAISNVIKVTVQWIAKTIQSIAATLKQAWADRAAAAAKWKLAIAGIAAAGTLALVVGGIVMAAVSAAQATANSAEAATDVHMAKGGIVTGPTLALVGEGSYNEAVVPLGDSPQFTEMKQSIAQEVVMRQAGTNRGTGTPIIIQLNGKELARALLPDLSITRPQIGVKLV